MNKLITITVLLLLIILIVAGCQPQPEENQETQPITLEITSPAEGRETTWGFTKVYGTVSPASAVVSIDNEGYAKVEEDGSFESDYIVLNEGKNEIRVTAANGSEEVVETVTVYYRLELHVSISLDLETGRDWFTDSPVRIGGRVSDPRAEVTINGQRAAVDNGGYILAMIELVEGTNTLTAVAKLQDQTATDTQEAIYVPPGTLAVKISTPDSGLESKLDLVKITGTVSDPEAHVIISNISIIGADSLVNYRLVPARITASGAFYAYVSLQKDENQIEATALRGSDRVTDTIDIGYHPPLFGFASGPELEVTSPQNDVEYRTNVLPVTGTADPGATVLVNGIEAVMAADGSFRGYAVLNETGENTIEVIGINDEGKTVVPIIATFVPPLVISLDAENEPGIDYTKEPMSMTGTVNKPEASVTVNGKEVLVDQDGLFKAQVLLVEGSNQIKAVATLGDESDEVYIAFMVENGSANPIPGYSGFFLPQLRYESEVKLKPGETLRLPVTLETRKGGPGGFSSYIVYVENEYGLLPLPWPEGLDVYLEPPEFMAYPNTTYNLEFVFTTTPELEPGIYYLHFYHVFERSSCGSGWIEVMVE